MEILLDKASVHFVFIGGGGRIEIIVCGFSQYTLLQNRDYSLKLGGDAPPPPPNAQVGEGGGGGATFGHVCTLKRFLHAIC